MVNERDGEMAHLNFNGEKIPHALFREFYETSWEGQFILDDKGVLIDVNPRFCEFLGYGKQELVGKDIPTLIPKSVQAEFSEILTNPDWSGRAIFIGKLLNSDGTISVVEFFINGANVDGRKFFLVTIKDVTVEKKYKDEVTQFEQIMAGLSENSLIIITLLEDNEIAFTTDSVSIISGYSTEELKSFKLEDFKKIIHPEDADKVINQYKKRHLESERNKTLEFEFRIIDKDGKFKWIYAFTQNLPSKEKDLALIVCFDITARKESEMKFRVIADNAQFSVLIVGEDDHIKYLNKATTELTGYSVEEILFSDNQGFLSFIHPDDQERVIREEEARSDGKTPLSKPYTFRILTKSGSVKWIEKYANKIPFQGKPANLVTLVDYSGRKESEDLLGILSDQMLIGVGIIQDDQFKYINDKLAKSYGFTVEEVKNWGPEDFLNQIHPEDRSFVMEQYKKKQAGVQDGILLNYELRIITKDGKTKWMDQFSDTVMYKGRTADLTISIDITDRKIAEQQLKESEEKFRLISDKSSMGIIILQDNVVKYVNERASQINETPIEEIRQWGPMEFLGMIHPEDRKIVAEQARKKQMGDPDVIENYIVRCITKKGNVRWIELYSKTIQYEGSNADFITVLDITDEYIAEMELKESEEKFRSIAEQSLIGFFIMQDGLFKYINDKTLDMIEYSRDEVMAWPKNHFAMLIHEEDRDFVMDQVIKKQTGVKEGILDHYNYRIVSRTEKLVWVDQYTKLINYGGEHADMVTLVDITDRKQAEKNLEESELRYRHLFENSESPIILFDTNGIIINANNAVTQFFGLEKDDLIGKKYTEFAPFLIIPTNLPENMFENLNHGKLPTMNDIRLYDKDGGSIWFHVQNSVMKIGDERFIQSVMYDITEKKKVEQVLEEENKKLKALDELRKAFISNATHELKTPLSTLYSATDFLLTSLRDQLGPNAIDIAEHIYRGANRLRNLINNMLDISRIEHGKLELKKEKVNLVELIKNILENLDYQRKAREHTVRLDIPSSLTFPVDKFHMEQIITNLLSNAIKYTPIKGDITIYLGTIADGIKFGVFDNGVGITPEEKEIIFQQFGKIDRSDLDIAVDIQGSGLGLFISKNLVELHGGKIWVESEGRMQGSKFYFTLPFDVN